MGSRLVVVFALAASSVAPSLAEAPAISIRSVPPPDATGAGPPKLICHDEVMPGTRLLMRHTCGTAAQWREYQQNMRYDLDRVGIISSGQ